MILKKPYAFLIKRFRLIHLTLAFIMVFLAYKTNSVLQFFTEFINIGYYGINVSTKTSDFINVYNFIAVIIIIIIALIIYTLMKFKNKPTLAYRLMIVGYIIVLIATIILLINMGIMEVSKSDPRTIRMLRDLAFITTLIQYLFIVVAFIRGIGFDIRKFNFGDDIHQLEIDVKDNEEFELMVGLDTEGFIRRFRKFIRKSRYYIVENKYLFRILIIIIIIISIGYFFLQSQIFDKKYKEKQIVNIGSYNLTINNAFITDKNVKGDIIAKNDEAYLIVSYTIQNISSIPLGFDPNKFELEIGHKRFPIVDKGYEYFYDYGKSYINDKIKAKSENQYIIAFKLNKALYKNELIISYLYGLDKNKQGKSAKIIIKPNYVDEIKLVSKNELGEIIKFNNSIYSDSSIRIKDVDFNNSFNYIQNKCVNNICRQITNVVMLDYVTSSSATLMRLTIEDNINKNIILKIYSSGSFLTSFGKLHYLINGKKYVSNIIDKTPIDYKGDRVFLQVPESIKKADEIYLKLIIRNMEYDITLK